MSIWKRLFGRGSRTSEQESSGDTYKCRKCGRKTSGTYLIVGVEDPFAPPYYGGKICERCAKKAGALT